jgi:hypothetical protein
VELSFFKFLEPKFCQSGGVDADGNIFILGDEVFSIENGILSSAPKS